MIYKENPKTKGSGIMCAIPQTGRCPNKCEDCFFQSGRSYLEPLSDNLPNMPESSWRHVVRINDGNDSNIKRDIVVSSAGHYQHKFYNTAIPKLDFDGPVVLTVNPGKITDSGFHWVFGVPTNLMFVRARVNAWNVANGLIDRIVEFYTKGGDDMPNQVPVILTFMAYHDDKEIIYNQCSDIGAYVERKRTLNSYWAITTEHWRKIMRRYEGNKWVHSCGDIEGEHGDTHCRHCGNCLREYFATITRMERLG